MFVSSKRTEASCGPLPRGAALVLLVVCAALLLEVEGATVLAKLLPLLPPEQPTPAAEVKARRTSA